MAKDKLSLSSIERRVLVYSQLRGELPSAQIGRALGFREETVRRAAGRLLESGHFCRKASLNLSVAGWREYNMYFTLNCENARFRNKILAALSRGHGVKWLLEMTGQYEGLAGIVARPPRSIAVLLDQLSAQHGNFLFAKEIVSVLSYRFFGRRYLCPLEASHTSLLAEDEDRQEELDALDRSILREISRDNYEGVTALARKLRVAHSTVRLRIEQLRRKGILVGITYNLEKIPPFIHAHRVLIYTKGHSSKPSDALLEFAKSDNRVVYLIRTLGAWDYEIQYESLNRDDIKFITGGIMQATQGALLNVKVFAITDIVKRASYPETL